MRRTVVIAAVLAAMTAQAHASSGISCKADDPSIAFDIGAAFGRSLGSGMINFGGSLKVLLPDAPRDLRTLKLDRRKAAQVWFYGKDIKLQVFHERPQRGPSGSLNLVIDTRAGNDDDEDTYKGTYELTIRYAGKKDAEEKQLEAKGKVECTAE